MKQSTRRKAVSTTTPPPALLPLQQALAKARSIHSRRRAALHIIHAYYSYYQPNGVRRHMEQLYKAATGIQYVAPAKIGQQQKQLFFYQFTLLLLEAAAAMRYSGDQRDNLLVNLFVARQTRGHGN